MIRDNRNRPRMLTWLSLTLFTLLASSCGGGGGGGGGGEGHEDLSGKWGGTVTFAERGVAAGHLEADFDQQGQEMTGTYSLDNDSGVRASGRLTGRIDGTWVQLIFEDITCPATPVTFDGFLDGYDRMAGPFDQPQIPGDRACPPTSGAIDISRY